MTTPKLTPADTKRCQAYKQSGCWPDAKRFMVIGPPLEVRCKNKPTVIVKETKTNPEDGKRGSMSLCDQCLTSFLEAFGKDYATVIKINR